MRTAAIVLAALLLVPFGAGRAEALSLRDLIELSRAGLGDEVLLALIEVDQAVFPIDAATLKSLKQAGVSERVILAVVRSGRARADLAQPEPLPPQPPLAMSEPRVIVIDHHEAPQVREVAIPVAVPIYVPVVPRVPRAVPRSAEPVYWGWGGKLRPDAWQPTPAAPQQPGDGRIRIDPPIKPDPPIR